MQFSRLLPPRTARLATLPLTLNLNVKLTRVESPYDKGPYFRIYSGNVDLGAVWQKGDGARLPSVKLDDPELPRPIYASLIEVEGEEGLLLMCASVPLAYSMHA
jgi:uncharacterized protein (DUF736 family)